MTGGTAVTTAPGPEVSSITHAENGRTGRTLTAETWDAAVRRGGGHLLQSWRWGEFKARYGWRVERVAVEGADGDALAQVLYRRRGPISLGYVPRGPAVLGGLEAARRLFVAIDEVSRRHNAVSLIVEPNEPLPLVGRYRGEGFVRGPDHLQPSRTVQVTLRDDDALIGQMHPKTRYNVRLAKRRGVVVERVAPGTAQVDRFYALMRETADRNDFQVHARDYYETFLSLFGEDAALMFALADGETAAGLIAVRFGEEAIYMYGASSTRHRAHGAAFLLQHEAMRWARDAGCTRYDLWGIPAVDPTSSEAADGANLAGTRGDDWRGLYEFKVRFGGAVRDYPPTLERRYRPVLAAVARTAYAKRG